jgi:hypothetical protein
MKYSNLRTDAAFATVSALHFLLQFAAWTLADSPQGTKIPWKIVSFPLFYLLHSWATLYFWMVAVLNSIVWGMAAGLFPRRRETA